MKVDAAFMNHVKEKLYLNSKWGVTLKLNEQEFDRLAIEHVLADIFDMQNDNGKEGYLFARLLCLQVILDSIGMTQQELKEFLKREKE